MRALSWPWQHARAPRQAEHLTPGVPHLPAAGNDLYMDIGERVMLKVQSVKFHTPPTPLQLERATTEEEKLVGTEAKPFVPMEVVGDMNGDGLGMLAWWAPPDEDEAGDQPME